ncbi:MAG: hypothetical protein J6X12_04480 [Paludibacteraceae bacterium]|nr:hypothetical protein [Paludibacteraceae bacterium]
MNYKFLPFVIGMALASTAANAADGTFDNLTVSNNATISNKLDVSGISTFNKKANFKLAKGANNNFIECIDLNKSVYNTMFYVASSGKAVATGFTVKESTAGNTYSASLRINYNNNRFEFDTNSYMNRYYPVYFKASDFTFDGGDMTVNGKITCKNELEVIALSASTIKADDINVNMNNAADYVFDESYNLKSLSEVESYVNEHKHLPGIPSAAEMEQNGVSVSAMSNMLLEKVEELTLHMIRLEKENAALKAEVKSLKK